MERKYNMPIAIAIDGPAGAGKSSIARKAAEELNFIYVDTGALYRAIGLAASRKQVQPEDAGAVSDLLKEIRVELAFNEKKEQIVLLNGEDVSHLIRTPEASMMASAISAVPQVRSFLLDLQRNIAKTNDVIMDGRDIGTVVLPDAKIKIFLFASPEDRARRRYEEMREKGMDVRYEDVLSDVKIRDYNDSHREIAPLKPAEDSICIDTTGNTFEQSVALLIKTMKENM